MSTPRHRQGRRNCRDCAHFRLTPQGPRCRFRGAKPAGVCAVFCRTTSAPPPSPPDPFG